jgi:hypothetical protein
MEILEVDVVTGKKTALAPTTRIALRALRKAEIPFAVIGATALAVRGLPRMTKDLDVVVATDDAWAALDALLDAGFVSAAPIDRAEQPEAMYVLVRGATEVDLLVASGEPESTVIAEATEAQVFGVRASVATLEQLVLMYLYSNQVRHQGDLARIVTETKVDLREVERYLADVHPEMLRVLRDRVLAARHPPPPPPRPKKGRRERSARRKG